MGVARFKTIVTNCHLPDGIVVDTVARHIYWTNMGVPSLDDGSIERADHDGSNRRVGGPGGIEHFFQQFTGPMAAWWKTLGSPVLIPSMN